MRLLAGEIRDHTFFVVMGVEGVQPGAAANPGVAAIGGGNQLRRDYAAVRQAEHGCVIAELDALR